MSTVENKVNTWLQGAIGHSPFNKSVENDQPRNISVKTSKENMHRGSMRVSSGKEYSTRRYFVYGDLNKSQTSPPNILLTIIDFSRTLDTLNY